MSQSVLFLLYFIVNLRTTCSLLFISLQLHLKLSTTQISSCYGLCGCERREFPSELLSVTSRSTKITVCLAWFRMILTSRWHFESFSTHKIQILSAGSQNLPADREARNSRTSDEKCGTPGQVTNLSQGTHTHTDA